MSTVPAPEATAKKDPQVLITDAINSISHIATLPEITLKIIAELVDNCRSTAQDLNSSFHSPMTQPTSPASLMS